MAEGAVADIVERTRHARALPDQPDRGGPAAPAQGGGVAGAAARAQGGCQSRGFGRGGAAVAGPAFLFVPGFAPVPPRTGQGPGRTLAQALVEPRLRALAVGHPLVLP